jgi:hypothetical protein
VRLLLGRQIVLWELEGDRLLIAQARTENVTIVSAHNRFSDYDVSTLDANT